MLCNIRYSSEMLFLAFFNCRVKTTLEGLALSHLKSDGCRLKLRKRLYGLVDVALLMFCAVFLYLYNYLLCSRVNGKC